MVPPVFRAFVVNTVAQSMQLQEKIRKRVRKVDNQALADIDGHKRLFYGQRLWSNVDMQTFTVSRTDPDSVGPDLLLQLLRYWGSQEIYPDPPRPAHIVYFSLELEVFDDRLIASTVQRFPDWLGLCRIRNHFCLEKDVQVLSGPSCWNVRYKRSRTTLSDQVGS